MIRKIIIAALCVVAPVTARAQTANVSGNLKDVGVTNVTGNNTFVRFTLENYVDIPRVIGTNAIATQSKDFHPDANGNISGTIQENNVINSGGVTGNTFYRVCVFYQGQSFQCDSYSINAPFNLATATPLSTPPQTLLPPNFIGTLANLPTFCTIGQVYFATDASPTGANLYFCDPVNVWTQQVAGGGGGTPCVTTSNAIQYNSLGNFGCAQGITTPDGNSLFIKGLVPWVDLVASGGIAWGSNNAPQGNWATTTASSTSISMLSASIDGGSFTFHNGNGIMIYGAGATNTMSTPGAPTVTPGTETGATGDGVSTAIPSSGTGASTYIYTVVARDLMGGLTAASSQTTITTGQATLGLTTATISSITRSNATLTVVTSAANLVNQQTAVHIIVTSGCANMNGWYTVSSVTNSTTFVINGTPTDSRAEGWNWGDCTLTGSTGTVSYYVLNNIKVPAAVTGAFEYYVCAKRPGDSALKVIGVTQPSGLLNGQLDLTFNDYGSPFMDSQTYPEYVTNSICTSASATNDMYTGIVTAGAGSTTLTVSPAPLQSVTNAFTAVDNGPVLQNALNAATYGNNGFIGSTPVLIPATTTGASGLYYNIYSPVKVPTKAVIFQDGWVLTNEPIVLQGSDEWLGSEGPGAGAPQFGWGNYANLYEETVEPAFYIDGGNNEIGHVTLFNEGTNGGTLAVEDNAPNTTWDHVNFVASTNASDYLGMALDVRDTSGTVSALHMHLISATSGPSQVTDASWTPLLWFEGANTSGGCAGSDTYLKADNLSLSRRSLFTGPSASTGCSSGIGNIDIDGSYEQGGITPFFTLANVAGAGPFYMHNISLDTEGMPIVACLTFVSTDQVCGSWEIDYLPVAGVNTPVFSGTRPASARLALGTGAAADIYKLPNRNGSYEGSVTGVFAPIDTGGSALPTSDVSAQFFQEPVEITNGSSLLFAIAQPSSASAAVAASGSVPNGSYYYCVSAIGFDLGESICSIPSSQVTTTTGNNTVNVTWTNPVGSQSSNVYRCSLGASCLFSGGLANPNANWTRVVSRTSGASYSDTNASGTTTHLPFVTGTGVSGMSASGTWTPLLGCPEVAAPSGIAGWDQLYCDSTNHALSRINGTNTATPLASFTGSLTASDCVNIASIALFTLADNGKCATYSVSPTTGDCVTWAAGPKLGDSGSACGAGGGGLNTNMNNMANPTAMSQSLIPGAVNTVALGSAALPLTNFFFGTVANQSISGNTGNLTANRVVNWPDATSTPVRDCPAVANKFVSALAVATGICTQANIGASATMPFAYAADSGTSTAYVVTLSPAVASYTVGLEVDFLPANANTSTTPTLNVNGVGAATITKFGTAALALNDLVGTQIAKVIYDGTDWELQNPNTLSTSLTAGSTNTLTNKAINAESTGNSISIPVEAFFPAAGCNNSTAANGWDIGVTNTPTPQCGGTTVTKGYLQFARGNVAYINWQLPPDWNSLASMDIELGATSTDTTNGHVISFDIQTGCSSVTGSAVDDPALNASQVANFTIGASQASGGGFTFGKTGLSMTGCAADDFIEIAITRDNSGTDTATNVLTAAALKFARLTIGTTKNAANR